MMGGDGGDDDDDLMIDELFCRESRSLPMNGSDDERMPVPNPSSDPLTCCCSIT